MTQLTDLQRIDLALKNAFEDGTAHRFITLNLVSIRTGLNTSLIKIECNKIGYHFEAYKQKIRAELQGLPVPASNYVERMRTDKSPKEIVENVCLEDFLKTDMSNETIAANPVFTRFQKSLKVYRGILECLYGQSEYVSGIRLAVKLNCRFVTLRDKLHVLMILGYVDCRGTRHSDRVYAIKQVRQITI